jgi:hypothetical protein
MADERAHEVDDAAADLGAILMKPASTKNRARGR